MLKSIEGARTYIGIIVTILGTIGIAEKVGGTEQLNGLVDAIFQVIGIVLSLYGNYKSHQKIEVLGSQVRRLGGSPIHTK